MRPNRPAVALAVVAVTLGLVGVADVAWLPPTPDAAPTAVPTARDDVVSGRAVCAVGDGREGTGTRLDVVHPGETGAPPARAEVGRFGDADGTITTRQLFPGSGSADALDGDTAATTGVVTWQDAPLSVARSWRIDDADDLPPGTAAGPCPTSTAATTWTIPGVSTEGGTEALLRLANPHVSGATVAVRFLTPEGPEAPTRLGNLSIGAQETVELSINEFIPERADVTVVVEVEAGRIAAEGVQLARSAIGDVDGVSLLQAATAPAESWTIPWVTDTSDRDPWLWVANDDDRTARVELTVHTAEGGLPAEGLSEVEVPPRTVRRIDLRGVLPEEGWAAVTARSDGVPVVVSGGIEIRAADVADTGLVIQRGAPAADTAWTVTGGPVEERRERLRLVNPTSDDAVVDGVLWDGSGAELPDELTAIEVPAGAVVSVSLDELLEGLGHWAITLRTRTGAVVAGTIGDGDPAGPAHWVAGIGTPAAEWSTTAAVPVRSARGMVQRLGTTLGIGPFDPFAPPPGDDEDDAGDDVGLESPTVPAPGDGPSTGDAPDGDEVEGEDDPDGDGEEAAD